MAQTLKKLHRELSAANHMNALRSELKEGGGVSGKEDMSISDLLRAKNLRKQVCCRLGGEATRPRGREVGRRLGRGAGWCPNGWARSQRCPTPPTRPSQL